MIRSLPASDLERWLCTKLRNRDRSKSLQFIKIGNGQEQMANPEHVRILESGVAAWNSWRQDYNQFHWERNPPDLSSINLFQRDLSGIDFSYTDLGAAYLIRANLRAARLYRAVLGSATLTGADLGSADLSEANLIGAQLIGTNLENARLTGCKVYGVSAWNLNLDGAEQSDLVITWSDEPTVVVDNIELAQFIYLLLRSDKVRTVIDTVGEKGVLILGRFTEERKAVLDAIRKRFRELGFVPIMFDFDRPTQRDFTETIKTLAGLSRFIIADITNPKSSPLELQATMPDYMVPFVPIIYANEKPFAMFQDLQQKYGEWVLDVLQYDSAESLLLVLEQAVVRPALEKGQQLLVKKGEMLRTRHVKDYM
jgi:hypothetical protein